MIQRRLQTLLIGSQVVGFATLLRSVAFDRWITVLASVLLILGATAALRGRTWGVVLAFASAVAFPVAWAIGIAPIWFVHVGVLGALPFLLASRVMARVDRPATVLLAALAATGGALAAVAWKLAAWDLFMAFPALRPSATPQNGLAVLTLLGLGLFAVVASARNRPTGPRIAATSEPTRIALDADARAALAEAEAEAEAQEQRATSRR